MRNGARGWCRSWWGRGAGIRKISIPGAVQVWSCVYRELALSGSLSLRSVGAGVVRAERLEAQFPQPLRRRIPLGSVMVRAAASFFSHS